jgi:hypothetical protein
MANYTNYTSGLGNVAAYQVSGKPFLTGSSVAATAVKKIEFPNVTKSFTLVNTGSADIRMYFIDPDVSPAADTGLHRFTLSSNSSFTMDVKCTELYIKAVGDSGFELVAELTGIPSTTMYKLTGSGIG